MPHGPTGAEFVLTLSCPDRPGIVHAVSGFLVERGANIVESQQCGDRLTDRFFMRIAFVTEAAADADDLRAAFAGVAEAFGMEFELWAATAPYRTLIMVSKHLHCLNDLLFRASTGALQIEIPAIVSNHPDAGALARSYGIEFHHVPVTPDTKAEAEARLMQLVDDTGTHLVVLARYMQVLSPAFCETWRDRIINIHHSFLPAFQGARPYSQAHDRGVKVIGVTAHYATAELDDGPIIDQDVLRVSHRDDVDDLRRKGRDLEVTVLARAVRAHVSHRVLVYGRRTVVFD
jgi:formyltetrahydrofolate deformylase